MTDLRLLVSRSRDGGVPSGERQAAFGDLVLRFQDLAFGCAYAQLGDFYLAEEAAQASFITAWQRLGQLREPDAFPGWLLRIVRSECHRLTRGKRLRFVPLEAGLASAARNDPQAHAERLQVRERVRGAVAGLPEPQRLVTALFYLGEYSQNEISAFLGVPVTTVVKRLHSARRRLRDGMLQTFQGELTRHRPSRDAAFLERVAATLRPPQVEDWHAIGEMQDLGFGEERDRWLVERQRFDEARYQRRHYAAEHAETGRLIGYGAVEQTIFLPRYRLVLVVGPEWLAAGVGRLLLDRLLADLEALDAVSVCYETAAGRADLVQFLRDRAFRVSRERLVLGLDLAVADLTTLPAVRAGLAARGISFSTLQRERERDPACLEKLDRLVRAAQPDEVARQRVEAPAFNEREAEIWLRQLLSEASFVAIKGSEYVGVVKMQRSRRLDGELQNSFIGVAPEWRRKGIATALSLCAADIARRHGFRTLRALAAPRGQAALRLYKKIGFRRRGRLVTLERRVRPVVRVAPEVTREYAGTYQRQDGSAWEARITRESGRLWAEFAGQKVELLAASQAEFFVEFFYGRLCFLRDVNGRVTGLVWRDGPPGRPAREFEARKLDRSTQSEPGGPR